MCRYNWEGRKTTEPKEEIQMAPWYCRARCIKKEEDIQMDYKHSIRTCYCTQESYSYNPDGLLDISEL